MPTPRPHQIEGAVFLANGGKLLADQPRVGKTGASILACDLLLAQHVLVVTKSSARAQWGRDLREWGGNRNIQVIYKSTDKVRANAQAVVVGWGMVFDKSLHAQLMARQWNVLILDEAHEAKNPYAKRSKAVYGSGLKTKAAYTWPLTGTPVPNAPNDLFTMVEALEPWRLEATADWPEVKTFDAFSKRYCVMRKKYVAGAWIEYALKGQNEEELAKRLDGFWLRRTQKDIGITSPIFSMLELHSDDIPAELKAIETGDLATIIQAVESGVPLSSEDQMHLGTIRRLTGTVIAKAVIEAAIDELENGTEKLVLMYWHQEVGAILREGLSQYGVVGIDGSTQPTKRQAEVDAFTKGDARVFCGQILAAGEAIDLSVASDLWFVEISTVPKDMAQAAMRVTNMNQTRQAFVRVCALEGSITSVLTEILMRKVASISAILESQ